LQTEKEIFDSFTQVKAGKEGFNLLLKHTEAFNLPSQGPPALFETFLKDLFTASRSIGNLQRFIIPKC